MNWLGKKQTKILITLKKGIPKTVNELETMTSIENRVIKNTLMELQGLGVVKQVNNQYVYVEPKVPIVYDTEDVRIEEKQIKNLSRVI